MATWEPYNGPIKPHIAVVGGHWTVESRMRGGPPYISIRRGSPEDYARTFGYICREASAVYRLGAAVPYVRRNSLPAGFL